MTHSAAATGGVAVAAHPSGLPETDDGAAIGILRDRYRQRRELANFYQAQITALNPAPLQSWSIVPLLVSVAALLISTRSFPAGWSLNILLIAVVLGMAVPVLAKMGHEKEAAAINERYLEEHALLFPDDPPIELVGYLLTKNKVR